MLVSRLGWIFLCCLVIVTCCTGTINDPKPKKKLKILGVFGHLGKSHFDVFKPLLEELARRGHDLTVVSYFPRTEKAIATEPLPNYKDINLKTKDVDVFVNVVDLQRIRDTYFRVFIELYFLNSMASVACEAGLNHPDVKDLVKSGEQFDVVLTESFNTHCFFAVFHRVDAPFIEISTHQLMSWTVDELGISNEASYIPTLFSHVPRPMNFFQRTWNVVAMMIEWTVANTLFKWNAQSVAEKTHGPGMFDLKEKSRNVTLMFVNTHYTLHGAQPFPPNVIEVGGLHIPRKTNPLPQDIAKFLDDAHEGVLYFNLGSVVKMSTVPEDKLTILLNMFASIPRKVIWKWETDDLPHKPSNLLVKKWLPQFDIMNHPNVKCYFGHGGLLGLSEGVHTGIPMILMPLFGDQYQNAMAARARGVAIVLKYSELNERDLRHAVDEIFNNTRYRENARRLSKAYRDRPATPLETAVWWTEYIGRGNGVPYVRTAGANMSWCTRNLVDVYTFLFTVLLTIIYVLYRLAKYLLLVRKKSKDIDQRASTKKRD